MESKKRRNFLKQSVTGSVATLLVASSLAQSQTVTPRDAEGPYYPITPQKDKDADLTQVAGKSGVAKGTIIEVFGQVFDTNGNPVEDATIDLWQANSFGKYHHPHDDSDAPVDDNFQSWAIIQSGAKGKFKFKTVMPGAYPMGAKNQRTPHIHFKIGKHGYEAILTQMYFPDQALNETDGLYQRKSLEQQKLMTAQKVAGTNQFLYNIYMEKV